MERGGRLAREYKGWCPCLGSAFLGGHVYFVEAFVEKSCQGGAHVHAVFCPHVANLCLHENHSRSHLAPHSLKRKLRLGGIKPFPIINRGALEQTSFPAMISGLLSTYCNRKKKVQNFCVGAPLRTVLGS